MKRSREQNDTYGDTDRLQTVSDLSAFLAANTSDSFVPFRNVYCLSADSKVAFNDRVIFFKSNEVDVFLTNLAEKLQTELANIKLMFQESRQSVKIVLWLPPSQHSADFWAISKCWQSIHKHVDGLGIGDPNEIILTGETVNWSNREEITQDDESVHFFQLNLVITDVLQQNHVTCDTSSPLVTRINNNVEKFRSSLIDVKRSWLIAAGVYCTPPLESLQVSQSYDDPLIDFGIFGTPTTTYFNQGLAFSPAPTSPFFSILDAEYFDMVDSNRSGGGGGGEDRSAFNDERQLYKKCGIEMEKPSVLTSFAPTNMEGAGWLFATDYNIPAFSLGSDVARMGKYTEVSRHSPRLPNDDPSSGDNVADQMVVPAPIPGETNDDGGSDSSDALAEINEQQELFFAKNSAFIMEMIYAQKRVEALLYQYQPNSDIQLIIGIINSLHRNNIRQEMVIIADAIQRSKRDTTADYKKTYSSHADATDLDNYFLDPLKTLLNKLDNFTQDQNRKSANESKNPLRKNTNEAYREIFAAFTGARRTFSVRFTSPFINRQRTRGVINSSSSSEEEQMLITFTEIF